MFTGIIRYVGTVLDVRPGEGGCRLRLDVGPLARNLKRGDSLAVNGVCLTAESVSPPAAEFDAVAETLSRSTLGRLRAGAKVNLEPALSAEGRFDGHIVQGHVDGLATVTRVSVRQPWTVEFAAPRELTDQMVPKGSVALDGVSLTLAEVRDGAFGVALIPTTLAETTLKQLAIGDAVNVEIDVLGKYVRRCLRQMLEERSVETSPGGLTLEKLRRAGFA